MPPLPNGPAANTAARVLSQPPLGGEMPRATTDRPTAPPLPPVTTVRTAPPTPPAATPAKSPADGNGDYQNLPMSVAESLAKLAGRRSTPPPPPDPDPLPFPRAADGSKG